MATRPELPLVRLRGLGRLAVLWGGYLTTAVVPRRFDRRIAAALFSLFAATRSRKIDDLAWKMRTVLGPSVGAGPSKALAREHYRMRFEVWWGRLRGLHRRGWQPRIEVEGIAHLHRALSSGRGVVLWRMRFCGTSVVKQALWRQGVALTHLSRADHGTTSPCTRLGLGLIAPFYCRTENPYLAERVVIPVDDSLAYMRVLIDRLKRNACLSIIGEYRGRQNVSCSFFGKSLSLAQGAPSLAWRTGAVLLTVHVVRLKPFDYKVVIEGPIAVDQKLPRAESVRQAAGEYGRRLERHVAEHAACWYGWTMGYV